MWFTEHHLFEDGYLNQPLTYLAAVAARTKRVRLGIAIIVAPLRLAAQIAEEAALADIISDGRLELGLGPGYRVPEFELFGVDVKQRYVTTDSRARELRSLWAEARFSPKPVQSCVPIWMGYQGPKGARRAGLVGEGLLSANARLYPAYRQGLLDGGHDPNVARMGGPVHGWVSEDPEADWPVVKKHFVYQFDSYRRYSVEGTGQPIPRPIDAEKMRARELGGVLGYWLHATPEEAAFRIRQFTLARR